MSIRTIYDPRRMLSRDLKDRIIVTGVDLDNYVSNIDNSLRIRGLADLADEMRTEIESYLNSIRTKGRNDSKE